MGQLLRVTFEGKDYSFQILNNTAINKETEKIQLLLDGTTQTIIRNVNSWEPEDDSELFQSGLANAIGKAISLRYRI